MSKITIFTSVAILALGTVAAVADSHMMPYHGTGQMMQGYGGKGYHGSMMTHMHDMNGDGVITASEFKMRPMETFKAADRDKNSALNLEEFEKFTEMQRAAYEEAMQRQRFKMMDTDGDGVISAKEMEQNMDKRFMMMDRNEDGTLNMQDWMEHRW